MKDNTFIKITYCLAYNHLYTTQLTQEVNIFALCLIHLFINLSISVCQGHCTKL